MTSEKLSSSALTVDTMDSGVAGVAIHRTRAESAGPDYVSSCGYTASEDEATAMDSPGISQHSLSRAVTTPPKETTLATDNQDAPDGEQNRFKLMWGILKKLVGARDIVAMRISVPAQLLEPMSNLEYWNYMDRPDYFACLADPDDPVDRMLGVVRWWYTKDLKHIHGRLVKPYNSTLGEQFICRWRVPKDVAPGDTAVDEAQLDSFSGSENNNYKITYITEQISHHPPVSAFQYACEEKGLTAVGIDHICVGFSGTSIKIAAGEQNLGVFLRMRTRDGEEYHLTHPHAHITGWLRGNPYIVQADRCIVTCAKTGLQVVLECKDEKWIGKPKHLISGKVFRYDPDEPNTASNGSRTKDARKDKKSTKINDADVVATIGGSWQGVMDYTKTGTKKQTLIDLSNLKPVAKIVRPVEEQSEHESRKVWYDVTSNIVQKNFPAANRAKQTIEEQQRKIAVERKNNERDEFSSVYFNVPEPGIPVLVKQPDQY